MGRSIGGHHRSETGYSEDWLTPPDLLARLGPFDLDPCTPREMPWATSARRYTPDDDGLAQPWEHRVWLNPPYGRETGRWLRRLAAHGDGIALVFARTETGMFFRHVWAKADAVLFLRGRLAFHRPDGSLAGHNSGGPSVLVAYGRRNVAALAESGLAGVLIELDAERRAAMPLFGREVSSPC
jgi:hypothetical protein